MLNDVLTDEEKASDAILIGKPIRVQRKRTKGFKMPENTVYVGRPTKWGNPFNLGWYYKIGSQGFEASLTPKENFSPCFYNSQAVNLYKRLIKRNIGYPVNLVKIRRELAGKNLACWCPTDRPCHADFLLEIANS